ncbi:extracellular catalytic domain type 2 short-chain-length polyhydroxyalkanoate depolymerase [Aliiglaciecola litoralis]|uniref:PHB depolymerase family esterase n=1 Tax=Aliiglaciecola litoralis TaxID=582857 RepID=A0ABP3WRZ8_9ALTE
MKIIAPLALGLCSFSIHAALPELNINIDKITVSGLSSGGYMANQFHLAHSDWVDGAAILAAGPYYCAQGSISTALTLCVNKTSDELSLEQLQKQIQNYQQQAKIASTDNLKNSRVWLFHGTLDSKIVEPVTQALYQQYKTWVPEAQIRYVDDKAMAHLLPTTNFGSACDTSESPFIGNCNYDAAGEFLTFLKTELNPKATTLSGKVVTFDQQQLGGKDASSLADLGYAYVPAQCADKEQCEVHVSFHGCNQNAEAVGQQFVQHNGLNQWADTNNLVVLYPQTKSSMMMPLNPQGCWDWWGYTGEDYATADGEQIRAVKNMLLSIAQPASK